MGTLQQELRKLKMNRVEGSVVKFEGEIIGESYRAIRFKLVDADGSLKCIEWFPLSQIKSIHRTFSIVNDTLDSIVVTEWIARQKGLLESEEI